MDTQQPASEMYLSVSLWSTSSLSWEIISVNGYSQAESRVPQLQDSTNEFIIQKLNRLVVADFTIHL